MGGFLEYIQGKDSVKKPKKTFDAKDVIINCPQSFSDIHSLLESLKEGEGFIVDFEKTDSALAQRMLDFLSGGAYVISGRLERIKQKMYIALPCNKNKKTKGKK